MKPGPDCQALSNNCAAQPETQFLCWQQSRGPSELHLLTRTNELGQSSSGIITTISATDLSSVAGSCQNSELVTSHGEGTESNFSWWQMASGEIQRGGEEKKKQGEKGSPQTSVKAFSVDFNMGREKYGSMYVFNTNFFVYLYIYLLRNTVNSLSNRTQRRFIWGESTTVIGMSFYTWSQLWFKGGSFSCKGYWFPVLVPVNFTLCTGDEAWGSDSARRL